MSVLSRPRTLRRSSAVPAPRPAAHDGGLIAPVRPPHDQAPPRRRAALVLAALVAAVAAGATTAVVLLTGGDDATTPAPGPQRGVTELDTLRDEVELRRQLNSDASRASDAAGEAARAGG